MSGPPTRILVVDDEPGMREGCRRILATEGFDVQTAEDGLAALEIFGKPGDFAAAIVDLKMPRMGGIELIERLRKRDEDVVILVVTAYAAIDTAVEATKRGAYTYIPKPFTPDELLLPVRNGLEKRALSMETKRLREERERRLLEVTYERSKSNTIVNCMMDAVLVVNRDRQIVLRNQAAAHAIPGCAGLALPAPLDALNSVPGGAELTALINETLSAQAGGPGQGRTGGGRLSREIAIGKNSYIADASPVGEPSGEILGTVAVLRDITSLKRLDTAKSLFLSLVAHEIKSPLAAIEGYLNMLRDHLSRADQAGCDQMIRRCLARSEQVRQMVVDLLDLTWIESGQKRRELVDLDVRELARSAIEAAEPSAAERKIAIAFHAEAPVRMTADREEVGMILNNLLSNAVKFNCDGGKVDVALRAEAGKVVISVSDTGIGMTPEESAGLFNDFVRIKNDKTRNIPGSGLGLSIVKKLVDLYDGTVAVAGRPDAGSTFTIVLNQPRSDRGRSPGVA